MARHSTIFVTADEQARYLEAQLKLPKIGVAVNSSTVTDGESSRPAAPMKVGRARRAA